ncbi:hypothetical protein F8A10_14260 [Paracoccus kondratievae]|nr:hypothetical protein F8A10_14260 [Paracoccus kondratievae]
MAGALSKGHRPCLRFWTGGTTERHPYLRAAGLTDRAQAKLEQVAAERGKDALAEALRRAGVS